MDGLAGGLADGLTDGSHGEARLLELEQSRRTSLQSSHLGAEGTQRVLLSFAQGAAAGERAAVEGLGRVEDLERHLAVGLAVAHLERRSIAADVPEPPLVDDGIVAAHERRASGLRRRTRWRAITPG